MFFASEDVTKDIKEALKTLKKIEEDLSLLFYKKAQSCNVTETTNGVCIVELRRQIAAINHNMQDMSNDILENSDGVKNALARLNKLEIGYEGSREDFINSKIDSIAEDIEENNDALLRNETHLDMAIDDIYSLKRASHHMDDGLVKMNERLNQFEDKLNKMEQNLSAQNFKINKLNKPWNMHSEPRL